MLVSQTRGSLTLPAGRHSWRPGPKLISSTPLDRTLPLARPNIGAPMRAVSTMPSSLRKACGELLNLAGG
jgi:hypothetical protein